MKRLGRRAINCQQVKEKSMKMKTKLTNGFIGVALLFASASHSWALPPRQYVARGVIQSIDGRMRSFTLERAKGGEPLVFVWKDSTRFTQRGNRVCNGALQGGLEAKVYYRREIGQLVPREVNLRSEAPTGCTTVECCTKGRLNEP